MTLTPDEFCRLALAAVDYLENAPSLLGVCSQCADGPRKLCERLRAKTTVDLCDIGKALETLGVVVSEVGK